ncbi:hypothetical protein Tco_0408395 [Tanacetum coccineum]
MTWMMYKWIMKRKLDPMVNTNRGVSNFTGRIKGMHVFMGNFTYIVDFMIVKDISSIIDPRLSQVVLGKPFVEISNKTHDSLEGTKKRRGVEYVMSKILGFYKERLKLGLEYMTGMDDEGEVTLYLIRRSLEVLRKFHWMILGGRSNQFSHVSSPLLSKPREYYLAIWEVILDVLHMDYGLIGRRNSKTTTLHSNISPDYVLSGGAVTIAILGRRQKI